MRPGLSSQCGRFPIAFALSHHRPSHARDLVCERDRSNLRWPAVEQLGKPGPRLGTVDFGIADDGQCAGTEERPKIPIALLGDIAEPFFAAAGILLRHKSDPGGEVTARSKGFRIGDACNKCCCKGWANPRQVIKA